MFKYMVALAAAAVIVTPALARIEAFPGTFHTQMVQTNGWDSILRSPLLWHFNFRAADIAGDKPQLICHPGAE